VLQWAGILWLRSMASLAPCGSSSSDSDFEDDEEVLAFAARRRETQWALQQRALKTAASPALSTAAVRVVPAAPAEALAWAEGATPWARLEVVEAPGLIAPLHVWRNPDDAEPVCAADGDTQLTGTLVWRASLALAALLEHHHAAAGRGTGRRRRTVAVEMGAGTGVTGLALARLNRQGTTVVLTDNQPEVLALLVRNAAANAVARQCPVVDFSWGTADLRPIAAAMGAAGDDGGDDSRDGNASGDAAAPPLPNYRAPHLDLVLASDVVYGGSDAAWGALLESLALLVGTLGSEATRVLVAFGNRARGTSDHLAFLKRAASVFTSVARLDLPDCGTSAHTGGGGREGAAFYDGVDLYELSGVVAHRTKS